MPLLIFLDLLVNEILLDVVGELAVAQSLQATADGLGLRLAQADDWCNSGSHGTLLEHGFRLLILGLDKKMTACIE